MHIYHLAKLSTGNSNEYPLFTGRNIWVSLLKLAIFTMP